MRAPASFPAGRSRDAARHGAGAGQRRAVERARELAEAAATVETLTAYLGVSTQHPGWFFYAAYTAAIDRMRDLLASLDQAGAGQADPGGNPPHIYIPAGPVEAAPYWVTARPRCGRRRSPPFWRAWSWALTICGS